MMSEDITQSLQNIEKYLEVLVRFNYAQIKSNAFTNETEEKAYELTGTKGRNEICKELNMSPNTLSKLWSKWFEMGLLIKQGNSYQKTIE